jgi:hypothetical protein
MHPDVGRRSLGPKRTTPPKRNMIAWRRWHFRGRVFKSRHPKFSKRRAGLRWHEIGRFLTQKRERSTDWWVVQRVAIPISAHPPRPQLPPIWGRFFWSAVLLVRMPETPSELPQKTQAKRRRADMMRSTPGGRAFSKSNHFEPGRAPDIARRPFHGNQIGRPHVHAPATYSGPSCTIGISASLLQADLTPNQSMRRSY